MNQIRIAVNCPFCQNSLMNSKVLIDHLPSIQILAKISDKSGQVYLSQIYGSYQKKFVGVKDIPDSIVECFCPQCHELFPIEKLCSCNAPVATLNLQIGGKIHFCTRNGCKHHSVEFENIDDAYLLFQQQHPSYYA